MKTIVKRSEIVEKLKQIKDLNSRNLVPELVDLYDEQGKNALIISLEEELYDVFYILISPVPYENTFKIYFDPFNICITQGTESLELPFNYDKCLALKLDGLFDTKTEFYSLYSAYNFIMNIKDETTKGMLDEMCTEIDYDTIKKLNISNIIKKQKAKDCIIYKREDISKYIDYELQETFGMLYDKNISLIDWGSNTKETYISLREDDLSKENKVILHDLMNLGLAGKEKDFVKISLPHYPNATVESINYTFKAMVNLFFKQEVKKGIVDIREYYNNIKVISKYNNINLPECNDDESKITLCKRANTYLTQKEGYMYYVHPELKKKDKSFTLKKNQ